MGMDGVEIVMAVEERFGIQISNEEAERIVKPRELIDLILTKIDSSDVPACLSRRAFHVVRRALVSQFGLERIAIRPSTKLASMIRRSGRRQSWCALQRHLGVEKWPELRTPGILILAVFASTALAIGLSWSFASKPQMLVMNVVTITVGLFILRAPAFQLAFPASVKSVGELSQFLAGQAPELFEAGNRKWARVEVSNQVREIVIDVIGCKNYSEDARFIEDLGLS